MPAPPRPHLEAPAAPVAAALVAGGVLVFVAVMIAAGPLRVLGFQRLAVLSAGIALVLLGALTMVVSGRWRPAMAGMGLIVSLIALGISLDVGFGGPFRGAPRPYLVVLGALIAVTGSTIAVHRAVSGRVEPDRTAALMGAGAGLLAVAGTIGPWFNLARDLSVSGLEGTIGKVTLALALVLAGAWGLLAAGIGSRARSALTLTALGAGVILAVFAFHAGALVGQRAGPGFGLYLVAVGSVVGAALAAHGLAGALGARPPSVVPWVVGALFLLGLVNLVLGFVLTDTLRDLGVAVFSVRIAGIFLVLIAAGLAAGQTWAWLLGFPIAVAGLLIAAMNAIRTEAARSIPILVALLYANVLNALWQSRGRVPVAPVVPGPEAPPAPGSPPPPGLAPPPPPGLDAAGPGAPGPSPAPSPAAEPELRELPEDRTWRSDPALREVLDPLNRRDHTAAAAAAGRLVHRFPDLDLIYSWWGKALLEQGDVAEARAVLRRGIDRSRRKYVLCERLGEVGWKSGDLDDAVRWWAQSVHGQESLAGAGEVGPYLYLSVVAQGMGLHDVSAAFLERVDRMRAGQIRLEEPVAADLRSLAARQGGPAVEATLRALNDRYLAAAPTAAPPRPDVPATPLATRAAGPAATRGPSRRRLVLLVAGVLLLGGGVALGMTVFAGDDAPRTGTDVPGTDPDAPIASPEEVRACLDTSRLEYETLGAGNEALELFAVTSPDETTTAAIAVYSSGDAARQAHAALGPAAESTEGLTLLVDNVLVLFAPPPTADFRRAVETCSSPG